MFRLRGLVAGMVDALPYDRPFDLIEVLATPLPERAIMAHTGVEAAIEPNDARLLTRPSGDASDDEVKRAIAAMLKAIRGDATDGSLASAIAGGLDRGQLNEAEATHLLADVLSAGADATSYAIANAVMALVEHPEPYTAIGAAYSVETAVEELLRFDSSTQAVARFASEATRLGSAKIARGDQLFVMVAAANRDPAAFEEPDRLDLGRSPNRHLAFALGAHYCLGASLAREILRETLGQLRSRFATLSLGPSGGERRGNFALRGFSRLEVVGTGPVLSPA
jgi:cytochrome P450